MSAVMWVWRDRSRGHTPALEKWRTSGTPTAGACRVPARCTALRVPGYGRVPSLRDDVCGDVGVT
uniref:hypothetical protein n=1 Tax=Candidatus Limisoma sp. TaxID=3076476 RepID=UPI0040283661